MSTPEPVIAQDMFGRPVQVGDLIAWGHSGRYAGTRIGRVYRVESPKYVRAWILERVKGRWVKAHHAGPLGIVKVDDTDLDVPQLEDL